MTKSDATISPTSLIKALRRYYEQPEPVQREPELELVYCFLLWEGVTSRAAAAIKRISDTYADINELRVTRLDELVAIIGKTYPRAEERAERLLLSLNDVYNREHAVSLAPVIAMNKRDGRKYLDSLEGIVPFASARAALTILGAHAVPIDDRTLDMLITAGAIDEGTDVETAIGKLERAIKSGDGLEAHDLLQAWAEDPDAPDRPTARNAARGKRSTRKTSAAAR